MKRKRRLISMLLVFFITLGLWTPGGVKAAGTTPEEILASMTTKEKISQMMVVSMEGYQADTKSQAEHVTVLPDGMKDFLAENHFGGVILFGENTTGAEQTTRLIDAIQVASASGGTKSQLLVSVDQEGGSVARMNECVQGPGSMALEATGKKKDITTISSIIGKEVTALGFNVNFAPIADVNNNPSNPIIGIRSFSDDPEIVTEDVKLSLDAFKKTGVIASPKHFPGHGDTNTDSHSGLPCINKSYDEIKKLELISFQAAVDQGMEMVMTAHIQFPQIETETYKSTLTGKDVSLPATLSKTIITDILRGDMGYKGVVITDAMNMDAIKANFDLQDAATLAINAGVDLLLIPREIVTPKGRNALVQEIQNLADKADSEPEFMEKVDAAVLRILKLKNSHGLLDEYDGSDIEDKVANAMAVVSTKANHEIEWDITKRAITMVKNNDETLPLTREGEKTVILTAYNDEPLPMEYAVDLVRQEGKLPKDSTYEVHSYRGLESLAGWQTVLDWIEGADNVIAVSEMLSALFLTGTSAGLLDELIEKTHQQGGRFILMSVSQPYDVARFQEADAIVITYGARSMNMDPRKDTEPMKRYGPNIAAALYLMLQEEGPTGKLPINLPELNETGDGYKTKILYERGTGLTYEKPEPLPPEPVDKKTAKVTFKVVNGSWNDGTTKNKTVKLTGNQGDVLKLSKKDIPAVGNKPAKGYKKGKWKVVPDTKTAIRRNTTFVYTYVSKYSNEWVNGKWYNKNGTQTYQPVGKWRRNSKGWWYEDTAGWYPKYQWQKIDGKWYFFNRQGYMEADAYRRGYYVTETGAWDGKKAVSGWKQDKKGWWYGDVSGWYAKNGTYTIDGRKYPFDANGYWVEP